MFNDFINFKNVTILGINATIVRGICKVIGTTLTKYKDAPSQNLVRNLIVSLVQHHPDATFEHLNNVFKSLIAKDLATQSMKTSQAAVIALGWSLLVATNIKLESDVAKCEFQKLIEYQCSFYQLGVSSGNIKVSEKCDQLINNFLKQNAELVDLYFEKLLQLEPSAGAIMLLSLILVHRVKEHNDNSSLEKNKTKLLDLFIKALVTVKVKPNAVFIPNCKIILNSITVEEFKAHIFSPLQRSMLRSPEVVLQGVGAIVHELNIDLSDFAIDLGKLLVQNLYTKDDCGRAEAVESLREVSMKCSSSVAIEILVKHLFDVFNGSDGKITVAEYRINVLQVKW